MLQDVGSYAAMQERLALLKLLALGREDLAPGRAGPLRLRRLPTASAGPADRAPVDAVSCGARIRIAAGAEADLHGIWRRRLALRGLSRPNSMHWVSKTTASTRFRHSASSTW